MPTITLTNGAAHWGMAIVIQSKVSLADLLTSGSFVGKIKGAKSAPPPNKDESQHDYEKRVTEWFDADLGQVEVSNEERDFVRTLLKDMGGKKELPANHHVASLAKAFDLDKP